MADKTIDDLFNLLDRQRHLPDYRLEPRVSPFFELFLPEVLEKHLKPVKLPIIPEFPLKKSDNSQSNKVDFFALSEDGGNAYLIELKTDMDSLRSSQADYLTRAAKKSIVQLVNDIEQISSHSNSYRKYVHLQKQLKELKLPKGPESAPHLKMVYIVPDCAEAKRKHEYLREVCCISLNEVACVVEKHGVIGERFAKSLKCWATTPAGSTQPDDPPCPAPYPAPNNCSRL